MELKILKIRESSGQNLTSAKEIVELMAEEAKADRECFWVIHLDTTLKVIEKDLVALGILNAALIHPREVFKKAIINSAANIITIHNHPSGGANPSDEDKNTWRRLNEAGELLQIPVLDNLIITPNGNFYSEKGATND